MYTNAYIYIHMYVENNGQSLCVFAFIMGSLQMTQYQRAFIRFHDVRDVTCQSLEELFG